MQAKISICTFGEDRRREAERLDSLYDVEAGQIWGYMYVKI